MQSTAFSLMIFILSCQRDRDADTIFSGAQNAINNISFIASLISNLTPNGFSLSARFHAGFCCLIRDYYFHIILVRHHELLIFLLVDDILLWRRCLI